MGLTVYHLRRLIFVSGLMLFALCAVQVIKVKESYEDYDETNEQKLMRMSLSIRNSERERRFADDGTPACKIPDLDIANPEIMKFIHNVPPLQCSPEDWVKVEGSHLYIDINARRRYGTITCAFSEIVRIDDYNYETKEPVESDFSFDLRESDFVDVKCESQTGKQWHSILAGVRDNLSTKCEAKWEKLPKNALHLSVLMFGFDSLSRQTFERKLPNSFRYIQKVLEGQVLEGYNIVGDGTPQALIPILTGKIELELPEVRRRMGDRARHVDIYPMIWRDYKRAGYVTGFMEDVPQIGTFTYRLKGFQYQPTDHYMRTYYLAAEPYFKNYKPFCMGGIARHKVMLNHIRHVFDKYKDKPRFVFGFHGELSHDSYNDIGVADRDLLQWMKNLKDAGHLNSTILIIMSDHGHRFADMRNTLQGKQEERLPFFSFIFPPWFKKVHPEAYANFIYNTQRLTTPFDVHATLKHILDFRPPTEGDTHTRGISLFDKVPLERTCADAFIEPHWCACLMWEEMPLDQPPVKEAAEYFVEFLNSYTEEYRNRCMSLTLEKVHWANKLIPTKGILRFERSQDADGFVAELSAKTKPKTEVYQIKVETVPGNGLFEVSISHNVENNTFSTKISDVSRINMYGSQARCVENDLFHLRKYCYCKT